MTTGLLIVSIACASDTEAQNLARLLVEQKLAACCQTHPIRSTYRWQGNIETADEIMLTAKTLARNFLALEDFVKANHSYDVSEIIGLPVTYASADYIAWVRESMAD